MALTEDLTFQMGSTGMILNTSATMPFVDVLRVRGLDSAPVRTTERDWEGNDGSFMDAEFEKGRPILLEGVVVNTTGDLETTLDTLKADYAPSPVLKQFFFKTPGKAERFVYVKPLGMKYDWDVIRRTGQASIQIAMFAEDPRIYESSLGSANIPLGATIFTGFGFSLGFSFGFGGTSSTTDQVSVSVGGNRPTPPIFTIAGPVTNPKILNDDTGDELSFLITLGAGETLVVDSKYKTVRLNGSVNRRNTLLEPDWFFLQPGTNILRFRAESVGSAVLTIDYRNAWR